MGRTGQQRPMLVVVLSAFLAVSCGGRSPRTPTSQCIWKTTYHLSGELGHKNLQNRTSSIEDW